MTYIFYGVVNEELTRGVASDYSGKMQEEIVRELQDKGAKEIYRFWVGEDQPWSVEEARENGSHVALGAEQHHSPSAGIRAGTEERTMKETVRDTVEAMFHEIDDEEREKWFDLARIMLEDLLCCTREWSAWSVGTMGEDDFVDAAEDDDIVFAAAISLYAVSIGKLEAVV